MELFKVILPNAQQAYVQTVLGGVETWISLPKVLRPQEWDSYQDPVCLLKLALYGHPDAGGYWELHCHEHLTSVGFAFVPDWCSTYWHPKLKRLLSDGVQYVDDFQLAGPSVNFRVKTGIAQLLRIPPEPLISYVPFCSKFLRWVLSRCQDVASPFENRAHDSRPLPFKLKKYV